MRSVLSAIRSKPAVPFGGKFRLIDFSLSNCASSGIDNVLVLTQYNPRSLIDHIGTGRPWDLDRVRGGGIKILPPYMSREHSGWYVGATDAVRYNLHEIDQPGADDVLVLAGDHIYKMDYRPMIEAHRATRAAVTVAVRTVPMAGSSTGRRSRRSRRATSPRWGSPCSPAPLSTSGWAIRAATSGET